MRKQEEMSAEQRGVERRVTMVYTLLYVALFFGFLIKQWPPMYAVIDFVALCGGISLYFFRPVRFEVRAFVTVFLSHFVVALVYLYATATSTVLIFMVVVTVTAGLYGLDKIIVIPIVIETICFASQGSRLFMNRMLDIVDFWDFFFPVISVYVIDYVSYMRVKQKNISQRKLIRTLHKMEYTQRTKREFLMNVSREIKTPMYASREICRELKPETNLEYIHNNVRFIEAAESWMAGSVEDLTDYSLMQLENMQLEICDYETRDLINDIVDTSMAMKGKKDIDIIFDVDATLPRVLKGDRKRILRIMGNVIHNAIEYTQKGGVCCSVTKSSDETGSCLLITVADTGCGMSQEFLVRIQEAFSQFEEEYLTNYQGVGLGILMTHTLLNWMGGSISIQSEVGKGTVVTMILPQIVVDESPIRDVYEKKTLCFFEEEEFQNREVLAYYRNEFAHISEQLHSSFVLCTTMVEFQDELHLQDYENILISSKGYREYDTYFERLAEWHNVIIITEYHIRESIQNTKIRRVLAPFWFESLLETIEDEANRKQKQETESETGTYILPEASVLIVDDNEMNLKILSRLLSRYQMKVLAENNGMAALEQAKNQDFDLIFIDQMMPDMNGEETMRAIRNLERKAAKTVPMIAMSSNMIPGLRDEFLEMGFNDFIAKPLEPVVLERIMHSYIAREKWIPCNEPKKKKQKDVTGRKENKWIQGLDTELGITYCGGEESYQLILKDYAQKGSRNWANLQQFFEEKKWKEYTIEVHGVKSALLSIGAREISDMAKRLEQAGKEGEISYVLSHHQELVEAYKTLVEALQDFYSIKSLKDSEEKEKMPLDVAGDKNFLTVISEEQLQAILNEMEEAAYLLDKEKMTAQTEKLRQFSYNGEAMEEACQECLRKIQKEDYISAWAVLDRFVSEK